MPGSGATVPGPWEVDKGYDTRECVRAMRNRGVTPHVAQRTRSAIDGRTTRHVSYRASQKVRKQVEEVFGWMKTVGGFRRTRYRGVERTGHATPRPGKAGGAPLDLWTRLSGPIECRWRMTRRDWPAQAPRPRWVSMGCSPPSPVEGAEHPHSGTSAWRWGTPLPGVRSSHGIVRLGIPLFVAKLSESPLDGLIAP